MTDILSLKRIASQLRMDMLESVYTVQSGHPGGSLSSADIVTALYFHAMNVDPKKPDWEDRDRFILSKGHSAPILYAALAKKGFFPKEELKRLRQADSFLQGASSFKTPGIDMTAGPLGQGLSAALGIALGGRYLKKSFRTFVIIGDGELQEGEIWEACMAAAKFQTGNLICFLDHNGIQMNGTNNEIMPIGSPSQKLKAFGWDVHELNGHDMEQLVAFLDNLKNTPVGRPVFVVASTVKGKGVSYMENTAAWHGACPNAEQYAQAIQELGGAGI